MHDSTRSSSRGQALVETVLTTAVLLIMLFAMSRLCVEALACYYRRISTLIALPIP